MRRTYKSKKESAGAIDPRDVLLTLDAKSSVFDAFYIQNIKQTKKDMLIGSTMQTTISNRVRKRKFVKKLKEQEPLHQPRESTTRTAFLTPDKSFRVNKAPDLFDQLLNSSCNKVETPEPIDLFKKLPAMQQKTYTKKKCYRKKNRFSSSDSSDSDKENYNSSKANKTADTSDIKSHKLLIEKEPNASPKYIDESINNIVNNLSLFAPNTEKVTTPTVEKYNLKKHELQTSPLCSTPFLEKYRGASIYKYSPIAINLDDSSKDVTNLMENSNDYAKDNLYTTQNNTNGIIINKIDLKKNMTEATVVENIEQNIVPQKYKQSNAFDINQNNSVASTIYDSILVTNNDTEVQSPIIPNRTRNSNKREPRKLSTHLSYMQTTEVEPFHGFEDVNLVGNSKLEAINKKCMAIENVLVNNSFTPSPTSQNSTFVNANFKIVENKKEQSSESYTSSAAVSSNSESFYDTCNSDNSVEEHMQNIEPIVVVERLNDSIFEKYFLQMANYSGESNDLNNISGNNDYASVGISDSTSNNSVSSQSSIEDDNYNMSIDNSESFNTNEIDYNDNSIESKPEDVCVSFVTTRRRNEYHNDSFIGLDNSIASEYDKTVLTNKNSLENTNVPLEENILENKEDNLNIVKENIDQYVSDYEFCSSESDDKSETDISPQVNKIVTRKSARESSKVKISNSSFNNSYSKTKESAGNFLNIATRKSSRIYKDSIARETRISTDNEHLGNASMFSEQPGIILQPGKRWERSLSIYRRMTTMVDNCDHSILDEVHNKVRKYPQSIVTPLEKDDFKGSFHNDSINSRRSTFVSKPSRSTIKIVRESNTSRASLCSTIVCEDLEGFLGEDCDDTIVELSKLSIADSEHEVTIIEKFHDTSIRRTTARDYVLRRCNQADVLPFDECYPDSVLKNCRKIGEGVYGEVFLWRAGDGRARVLKVIPIAGDIKVNGEQQKDFHEVISEIVIAMELSALRAPITDIEQHLNEGKSLDTLDLHSVENATDVFNEVLRVRCVSGSYPGRLLELWELYDECRGSENDNPASLPPQQQYIVLELGNAGQDLESYHFHNAEQSYAIFKQIAFGLAVAEEAYQFEHRDLHWGNVLISPTDEKFATFVFRGGVHRVRAAGVRAAVIDYSLSRASLGRCALYNDLAHDDALFDALGDYQFQLYRLMRDKLRNDWKNFEPYTNVLWLHYTVDKMITALRYTRTDTKIHGRYVAELKEIRNRILDYGSAVEYVLADEL